jgi:hypothetical protein
MRLKAYSWCILSKWVKTNMIPTSNRRWVPTSNQCLSYFHIVYWAYVPNFFGLLGGVFFSSLFHIVLFVIVVIVLFCNCSVCFVLFACQPAYLPTLEVEERLFHDKDIPCFQSQLHAIEWWCRLQPHRSWRNTDWLTLNRASSSL